MIEIVAWAARFGDRRKAARTGVLRDAGDHGPHVHIFAARRGEKEITGSCVVLLGHSPEGAWLDGFTAPPGDHWRSYVTALTETAVAEARRRGCRCLRTDVYEFGEATRTPLRSLGFRPEPDPTHPDSNRMWRVDLTE